MPFSCKIGACCTYFQIKAKNFPSCNVSPAFYSMRLGCSFWNLRFNQSPQQPSLYSLGLDSLTQENVKVNPSQDLQLPALLIFIITINIYLGKAKGKNL